MFMYLGMGVCYIFWIFLSVLYMFFYCVEVNCIFECDFVCCYYKLLNNFFIYFRFFMSY